MTWICSCLTAFPSLVMYGSIRNIAIPSPGIPQGIWILENLMVQIRQPLKKSSNSPLSQKIWQINPLPLQKKSAFLLLTSCKFTDETAKNPPYSAYTVDCTSACVQVNVQALHWKTCEFVNLSLSIPKRNLGSNFPISVKFPTTKNIQNIKYPTHRIRLGGCV